MIDQTAWTPDLSRRASLRLAAGALAAFAPAALGPPALAQGGRAGFAQWVESFRARARARGVSDATYTRVMSGLKPDTAVFDLNKSQPEFGEKLWQYLNRRVSDWRIVTGQEKAKEIAPLLARIEQDYGIERSVMLGLWGIESAYGDPDVQKNHMRPIFPALAALAWGEPRRKAYWEQELLNALVIVERGWSTPEEMRGSWAGAMGHTQWMPEVWLNVGMDYDRDGRVNPFGKPDDALGSTARYLVQRGKYRRGEHWGYEVRVPGAGGGDASRSYDAWQKSGVVRADGQPFPQPNATAKLWAPVPGGPAFLLGPNFYAVRSYNPSMNYTLSIVHLGDRVVGGGPLLQKFPGSERAPTLAEVQEIQRRLTALGYDTGGTDGRVGNDTMSAIVKFQRKVGMTPADGYAGVSLLAKLRQSS
ncbi:MAG: rane-bound lytic murein transglycosylase [Alphaproteobacteria bacterium]|jgi:lytic murein transglycosylase|nr:rane-bound lytic murein transglycosylase [Alphaproteobacteria bacterium]